MPKVKKTAIWRGFRAFSARYGEAEKSEIQYFVADVHSRPAGEIFWNLIIVAKFSPSLNKQKRSVSRPLFEPAPRAGLEPATTRLTAGCSTIELSRKSGTFPDRSRSAVPPLLYHSPLPGCKHFFPLARKKHRSPRQTLNPSARGRTRRSRRCSSFPGVRRR